jgi:uncharacterized membrane protein (DUF106 family)
MSKSTRIIGIVVVWYYLVLAIILSVLILFGSCLAIDYNTYRDLQRRLQEEMRRRLKEETVAAYT